MNADFEQGDPVTATVDGWFHCDAESTDTLYLRTAEDRLFWLPRGATTLAARRRPWQDGDVVRIDYLDGRRPVAERSDGGFWCVIGSDWATCRYTDEWINERNPVRLVPEAQS